jgi:hypothetical protein
MVGLMTIHARLAAKRQPISRLLVWVAFFGPGLSSSFFRDDVFGIPMSGTFFKIEILRRKFGHQARER